MQGQHFTGDLLDCQCSIALLRDSGALQGICAKLVAQAGLCAVGQHFHTFADAGGVTGLVLLAESHLAIHTWPELGAVTLDVYVCNFRDDNSNKARALMAALIALFAPRICHRNTLDRGAPSAAVGATHSQQPLALEWLAPDVAHGVRPRTPPTSTQSAYQRIDWYDTASLGRVLTLDGAFMLSERDAFIYHECMVHVAAIAHPAPRRALVMGGGDGCIARELLRHPSIDEIVIAELDAEMIAQCRVQLAHLNGNAFDQPRVQVVVGDALRYATRARDAGERFDLVVMDLSDPDFVEASPLYAIETYRLLRDVLTENGLITLHIGSPFFHATRFADTLRELREVFTEVHAFKAFMPLYGAEWGMACASLHSNPTLLSEGDVNAKLQQRNINDLRFYTPRVHASLFAWPAYAERLGA